MATKKCKYCQTDIDQKAKIFPYCKKDQRGFFAKHPIITGILVLFIIGIIASAGGSSSKTSTGSDSKNTSNNDTNSQKVKETKDSVKTVKLNEDVQIGDVKWKVVKAWSANQLSDYCQVPLFEQPPTYDELTFGTPKLVRFVKKKGGSDTSSFFMGEPKAQQFESLEVAQPLFNTYISV